MALGKKGKQKTAETDPQSKLKSSLKALIFLVAVVTVISGLGGYRLIGVVMDINSNRTASKDIHDLYERVAQWSSQDSLLRGMDEYMAKIRYPAQESLKEDLSEDMGKTGLRVTNMSAKNQDDSMIEVAIEGLISQQELFQFLEKVGRTQRIWYVKTMIIKPRIDVGGQITNYSGKNLSDPIIQELSKSGDPDLILAVKLEMITVAK